MSEQTKIQDKCRCGKAIALGTDEQWRHIGMVFDCPRAEPYPEVAPACKYKDSDLCRFCKWQYFTHAPEEMCPDHSGRKFTKEWPAEPSPEVAPKLSPEGCKEREEFARQNRALWPNNVPAVAPRETQCECGDLSGLHWMGERCMAKNCSCKQLKEARVPFSKSDACWCQPLDGYVHPQCPLHRRHTYEHEANPYCIVCGAFGPNEDSRPCAPRETQPECGAISREDGLRENAVCVRPRGHDSYHATTTEDVKDSAGGYFWHGPMPAARPAPATQHRVIPVEWHRVAVEPGDNARARVEPQDGLINVFEVYGKRADSQGWDFIVYKSQQSALDAIDHDLDDLEDGEELRVVFKRYTQEQMDEVIYE